MPPAFNLSQDQTLQFNPFFCQSLKGTSNLTQSNFQRNLLTREHFYFSKLLRKAGVASTPFTGSKQPGDNPLPNPTQRLKKHQAPTRIGCSFF
jgi:hypothetical protein